MVSLRPIQKKDSKTLQNLSGKNGQSYFLFESILPLSYTEREELHLGQKNGKLEFLAETHTGIPIGGVKIDTQPARSGHWGISFALFQEGKEPTKLFQKACNNFIQSLFEDYFLERLYACTLEQETRLHHFLRSMRFEKEGSLKRHFYRQGSYENIWIFGLLKSEFLEKPESLCSVGS